MNLSTKTKNRGADPEIGFLKKSISKPYRRVAAMPTVWELFFYTRAKALTKDTETGNFQDQYRY